MISNKGSSEKIELDYIVVDQVDYTAEALKKHIYRFPETQEFKALLAKTQKNGKARKGKVWISEEGNLFFSIYLKPDCFISQIPQLYLIGSLAIKDLLDEYHIPAVKLKWPNDVIVQNKKIASVMIDMDEPEGAKVKSIILSFAINAHSAPENLPFPAIFLSKHTRTTHNLENMMKKILFYFSRRYGLWLNSGFELFKGEWLDHSYHARGDKMTIHLDKNIMGLFETLSDSGALQIRTLSADQDILTISAIEPII